MPMGEMRPSTGVEDLRTGPVAEILNRLLGPLGSFSQGWNRPPPGLPIPPVGGMESWQRARIKNMESPLVPQYGPMSNELGVGSVAASAKRPLTDPRIPPQAQEILDRLLVKDTMEAIRRQNQGLPPAPSATYSLGTE